MNIFGIGLPEMALILVVALLVFGPKKLPEIGRSLAQALGSFKKAQQEFEAELKRETVELESSLKAPIKAEIERTDSKALPQDQPTTAANDAEGEVAEDSSPSEIAAEESVSDASTTSA